MLDLGGMKGKHVGDSETALRDAIKVVHAITEGKVLFLGCCNRTGNLPPELRRRFNYCSLFLDLPDKAERTAMWRIHLKKFGLLDESVTKMRDKLPDDDGWTGAEIEN